MAQGQPDTPQLDTRVRESLINLELLSRAAMDKGLDKEPRLAATLDIRRKDQLAKAYLEDYVKSHPVTDAEIQAAYDKAKAQPARAGIPCAPHSGENRSGSEKDHRRPRQEGQI